MAPGQRHDSENYEPQFSNFYSDDYLHEDDSNQEARGLVASDEKLEEVIKEILHNSRKLKGEDITVTVNHADVTLSGTVRTEEEKYMAGSLAQLIHGVGLIKNELVVKRNEGILPSDIGRKTSA